MNNETKRTKISVQDMVQLSVLIAILLLLELTGLGMIKTAGLEITIMLVPVIVGAIVMGPAAGALLGGVFGLISFWECFGKSSFGVVLMGINPFLTYLVCVPTRILAGWICGLVFKGLSQLEQEKQTIKKDLEESLQEAGAAREELAAVRQAQVEAYMKRKPFPKRQGTVELKDAILRL